MLRFAAVLPVLLLAAGPANAAPRPARSTAQGVCATFTEAQVRTLTGVATGGFSMRATRHGQYAERCAYGVTDGDLVLDVYHFPSEAEAMVQMAKLPPPGIQIPKIFKGKNLDTPGYPPVCLRGISGLSYGLVKD